MHKRTFAYAPDPNGQLYPFYEEKIDDQSEVYVLLGEGDVLHMPSALGDQERGSGRLVEEMTIKIAWLDTALQNHPNYFRAVAQSSDA
jgi:hypothetical protein